MLPFHRNKSFQNTPSPLHVATFNFGRRGCFSYSVKVMLFVQDKARRMARHDMPAKWPLDSFPNWHVSGCHFQKQVGWGTWLVATCAFTRIGIVSCSFKGCKKIRKARQKNFHLIICIMLLLFVLIVGNKNQNLPRECKKLSFPPRFSLFRALRYALVVVGKKRKQTFGSVYHSNKHYRSILNMSQIV